MGVAVNRIEDLMDARLDALLAAFVRLKDSESASVASSLRRLSEPGVLPSPWETWTLIGLIRHRKRQLWVAEIIRTRLRGTPADLAAFGALGHPDTVPQTGPVPGMPEWEYYFHGSEGPLVAFLRERLGWRRGRQASKNALPTGTAARKFGRATAGVRTASGPRTNLPIHCSREKFSGLCVR